MDIELKYDERLDDVLGSGLKIIQSPSVFAFSLDAALLANFTYVPYRKGKIIDLCTGNGIIPLLLSKKTSVSITGVEIQQRLYDMAERSIKFNKLSDQIDFINGDIKEMPKLLGKGKYDVVTCNPPYFITPNKEEINENEHLAIARHEIMCTLEDVIGVCSDLVKEGGKVSLVHRPGRLVDILTLMRKYKIEPKKIQFVYPKKDKEANILLVEGHKYGNPDLKILDPIIVYEDNNEYTKVLKEIIDGK
jgi:tRNA1(Val) A37 N6-methylase TrmN6